MNRVRLDEDDKQLPLRVTLMPRSPMYTAMSAVISPADPALYLVRTFFASATSHSYPKFVTKNRSYLWRIRILDILSFCASCFMFEDRNMRNLTHNDSSDEQCYSHTYQDKDSLGEKNKNKTHR